MTQEMVLANSRERKRARSAWWSELLQVDFRHALWPWLLYCALLFTNPSACKWHSIVVLLALVLAQAGVIVRVFGVDFDQGTMGRFMSFPVARSETWAMKTMLAYLLVMVPPVATVMAIGAVGGLADVAVIIASFGLFTPAVGSLMMMILKRSMLAWSTTGLSPFVVILTVSILIEVLGLHVNGSIREKFPYIPLPFLVFFLICGGVALVLSWRKWQRLEVTS